MSDGKITIIYDTYCGWCHGAAEVQHRHLF